MAHKKIRINLNIKFTIQLLPSYSIKKIELYHRKQPEQLFHLDLKLANCRPINLITIRFILVDTTYRVVVVIDGSHWFAGGSETGHARFNTALLKRQQCREDDEQCGSMEYH